MITLNPTTDLIRALDAAGNHRRTLQAYLGMRRVISEEAYGPAQVDEIANVRYFVEDWSEERTLYRSRPFRISWLPALDPFTTGTAGQNLILRERGRVIGGTFSRVPFVAEPHRGRGVGALIVLISDLHGDRFLRPCSYSELGFGARCAAHRDQVRLAVEAGLAVPDQVRDQYVFGPQGVSLAYPWGPEEQNASYREGRGVTPSAPTSPDPTQPDPTQPFPTQPVLIVEAQPPGPG